MTRDQYNRPGRGCWLAHHGLIEWRDYRRYGSGAGYPSMSSDAAARERARTATRVDGKAAYRGRVEVGDAGKTVPREPPPMPKETRQAGRARIPDTHQLGGIGRDVDRALAALDRVSADTATVLRAHYLLVDETPGSRAAAAGLSRQRYHEELSKGLMYVQAWLSALRGAA